MKGWNGRGVARLVALTLRDKGTTCHLCSMGGADSADHNPPRDDLVRLGVTDPDDPAYLFPAHLACNKRRKKRPITPDLVAELRAKRLADLGVSTDPVDLGVSSSSPRFARARERIEQTAPVGRDVVVIVAGPPCSGKSTYVREHAAPGDLVVDFDALAIEAGSSVSHVHRAEFKEAAGVRVAELLAEVEAGHHPRAWIIRTTVDPDLVDRLGARVVVLNPGRDTLVARAEARGRHTDYTVRVIDWWLAEHADAAESL